MTQKRNSKETKAVIAQFIDWSQAFDRQCPKLGIESFIDNGVRKSVIPVLISYFQDRQMKVKWHGKMSTVRQLPGGGPQGCHLGQQMYQSQSNDSGQCVDPEDRFKFVDDMSILEIINVLACGLTSYNFKNHIGSYIAIEQKYLPEDNCSSQDNLMDRRKENDDQQKEDQSYDIEFY